MLAIHYRGTIQSRSSCIFSMRGFLPALAMLLVATMPVHAGEIVDRIVATVNGHIILQSDWEDAISLEALLTGRSLDQVTPQDRKAALDRLIDQELLREQMRSNDFRQATGQEVEDRIAEARKLYPDAETSAGWQAVLARHHLTEAQLKDRLKLELDVMRLVDARLRPTVQVDAKSVESYYNQQLLPQLRKSGAKEVPLAEVTPKIKELLTQQKMNELLTAWLQNLRETSQIHSDAVTFGAQGQAQ